jgi:predicted nucleotidyltransferase component of viral defense system
VKIDVTPVPRDCVFPPEMREASPRAQDQFGYAEMRLVSIPDFHAGNIVAAVDRQHPRDLFDLRKLLGTEGVMAILRRDLPGVRGQPRPTHVGDRGADAQGPYGRVRQGL